MDMSYAERKQRAIENVDGLLADQRDDAEMVRDEQRVRDAEDRTETGERDAADFMDDRRSPGFARAVQSVRESRFAQERFHGSGAAELDAAFGSGPDRDDDDGGVEDDEDDFL